MRRRLAAGLALTTLVFVGLLGVGVIAASPGRAATTNGAAAPAGHTLTRSERGVLLVALTFILGAPLLAAAPGEADGSPARPRITLYDDPALLRQPEPEQRREGDPPPLR